jgi:hypothetical protein
VPHGFGAPGAVVPASLALNSIQPTPAAPVASGSSAVVDAVSILPWRHAVQGPALKLALFKVSTVIHALVCPPF